MKEGGKSPAAAALAVVQQTVAIFLGKNNLTKQVCEEMYWYDSIVNKL